MVVFQKLEGKTTTLNFWNQKLERKTTTLKNRIKRMEGNSTTPKNCVLTNFLHERSTIFLLLFSLIWFRILLRNEIFMSNGQKIIFANWHYGHFKFCYSRRNGFSKNYWELYCSSSKKIKLHSQHRGLDCCISQSRWTFILLFLSCKTAINKKNKKKDVGKGNEKHFKSKR